MREPLRGMKAVILYFSYTSKLKFALALGYFPCIIVLLLTYQLFIIPRESMSKQLGGLKYNQALSDLSSDLLEYEGLMKPWRHGATTRPKEYLQEEINARLRQIDQLTLSLASHVSKDAVESMEQIEISLQQIKDRWKALIDLSPEGIDKGINLASIFQARTELSLSLAIASELALNMDQEVGYDIHIAFQLLPRFRMLLAQLYLNILLYQDGEPSFDLKAKMLMMSFSLQQSNSILSSNVWNADLIDDVFDDRETKTKIDQKLQHYHATSEVLEKKIQFLILVPEGMDKNKAIDELLKDIDEAFQASFSLGYEMNKRLFLTIGIQRRTMAEYIALSIFLLLAGGGVAAGLYLTRIIRRPLNQLVDVANGLSRGDLSLRVPKGHNDEVGDIIIAFNAMVDYFENILSDATKIAQHIAVSSEDIITSAKELEYNLNSQEKTIKDIFHSGRDIMHSVQHFSEDIQKANQSAARTGILAETGRMSLGEMEMIMQNMIIGAASMVMTLSSLKDKMSNIDQVIAAIIKIADQSNLLSLNTAIRANKSGGAGRGFVVIAEKIREMANQIAEATLNIRRAVDEIAEQVMAAVKFVDEFSSSIAEQVKDVSDVSAQLNKLISDTQVQVRNFEEIRDSMRRQSHGIIDINKSIEQLRTGAQQTARSIHKLHNEIEYLHDSSQSLQKLTDKIKFSGVATPQGYLS